MGKPISEDDEDCLPALGQNATQGQLGEALVEAAMLQLNQLYERRNGLDFGVDGVIELTTSGAASRATGRQVGVQVKRGLSVVRRTRYGFTHYCTEAHANYWLRHSLPIIVVHSDPAAGRLRWQHVAPDTLRRTGHGYAIDLPPESDLHTSLDALRALANGQPADPALESRTFTVPYSMQHGVRIDEPELGLAALEFSRTALRGLDCRVVVEAEEEPDLVASIDAIRDVIDLTAEERRDAIIQEDILHRYRKHTGKLQRTLTLLLTEKALAELFGYHDQLLAEAIRQLAAPRSHSRNRGDTTLDAWPTYDNERSIIKFDVPSSAMDEFYAQNNMNREIIRMGNAGGAIIGDLNSDVVATRFLPVLAEHLVDLAIANNILDKEAFASIGVQPSMWRMGLA